MIVAAGKRAAAHGGYAAPAWLAIALAPEPADPPCDTLRCGGVTAAASTPSALPQASDGGGCSAAPGARHGSSAASSIAAGLALALVLRLSRRRRRR
jgi:hypothetical protein